MRQQVLFVWACVLLLDGSGQAQEIHIVAAENSAGYIATWRSVGVSDTLRDGGRGPVMVRLPTGSFQMGDLQGDGMADELPVHAVVIPRAIAIARYKITVGEFRRFVNATAYRTDAERGDGCKVIWGRSWNDPNFPQTDDYPVVCISWNDANAYAQWLSTQTGENYRLPTEAEWEYAARAGTTTRFWWGNEFQPRSAHCWECASHAQFPATMPVGAFTPNAFGLYDVVGNAWEWTASDYQAPYSGAEQRASSTAQGERALRSGGWFYGATDLRSANRGAAWPEERFTTLGFRVVRELR